MYENICDITFFTNPYTFAKKIIRASMILKRVRIHL